MDVRNVKFDVAKRFTIHSGKYKGRTLDEIASTDEGLKHLDSLLGKLEDCALKRMIEIYLNDANIQKELKDALGE